MSKIEPTVGEVAALGDVVAFFSTTPPSSGESQRGLVIVYQNLTCLKTLHAHLKKILLEESHVGD